MFERLVGTISGIREGIEEAAAVSRQEAARIRKEKREAAKRAKAAAAAEKAAATKAGKEQVGHSRTAKRVVKLGAAIIGARDTAVEAVEDGKELRRQGRGLYHQLQKKVAVDAPDDKLAALVGLEQTQQQDSPPVSGFDRGRGGLPPI